MADKTDVDLQPFIDAAEKKQGIPKGLLSQVVSSRGVNIPPKARAAILRDFGVDAKLSNAAAVEAAGILLSNALQDNNGDESLALAEYRSGKDRAEWGADTQKFVRHVRSGRGVSMEQVGAPMRGTARPDPAMEMGAPTATGSGVDVAKLQQSTGAKQGFDPAMEMVMGDATVTTDAPAPPTMTAAAPSAPAVPDGMGPPIPAAAGEPEGPVQAVPGLLAAYTNGTMPKEDRDEVRRLVQSGALIVPEGFSLAEPGMMTRAKATVGQAAGAIGELVTGNDRRTSETEAAPDWSRMPEIYPLEAALSAGDDKSGLGEWWKSVKAGVGSAMSSPEESVKVIQANFPDVKVRRDAKNNIFMTSSIDGKEYSIKPGFRVSDIPRAAGSLALGAIGGAGGIVEGGLAAAGTQAAIEGTQAATGGDFDTGDVLLAGGVGSAIPAAGRVAAGVKGAMKGTAPAAVDAAEAVAAPAVRGAPIDDVKLADLAKRASEGNPAAARQLAEAVAVDPAAVESAKRLGIDLPADVFSDSEQIRSALGGVRGKIGSEAEAAWQRTVREASDKADEVVQSFDGAPSPGAVSDKVLSSLEASREALKTEAKALYQSVDDVIKPSAPVTLENLDDVLRQSLKDLDGDVSALSDGERMMLRLAERGRVNPDMPAAAGRATHEAMKRAKADLQRAVRMGEGPFASNDQRRLKILERALKDDELANAARIGGDEIRDKVRLAHQMTAKQKGLEDRMIGAFGRDKEGSVASLMQGAIADASKGNSARLTKLLKAVPQDLHGEVLMTALSSSTRAKQGVAEAGFGFAEFAKTYAGLRAKGNEPIFAQLSKSLGPERSAALRDLYEISKRITTARANVKQTGKANQPFMQALEAESLVQQIAGSAMGKAAAVGVGGGAGGGLGAVGASALLSSIAKGNKDVVANVGKLLISPEFSALAVEMATNPTVSGATVKKAARSQVLRDFLRAAKLPHDPTSAETWLNSAIQAARQTRPRGEQ